MTRILLIEDHPIVRDACRLLLQDRQDFLVIEARSGAEGAASCAAEDPDVVVLDLGLPDRSGFEVLRLLRTEQPARRVIVFSMYEEASFVLRAMDAGASGYVTKSDDPDALLDAIDAVMSGEVYLGAAAARQVALSNVRRDRDPVLSARERKVMALLAEGMSLARIAERLGVSYRTSASVVAQLRTKLDRPSTAALIRHAVGLMPSDSDR